MFLKVKIGLTIISLYEILSVVLMQSQRVCDVMFGTSFCDANVFKYFIICFAVPMIVFLIIMWVSEIIDAVRRRHTLFYKAKHAIKSVADSVRGHVSENVSAADLEKLITAALMAGLNKYVNKNMNVQEDDESVMAYDEEMPERTGKSGSYNKTLKKKSVKKK